MKLSKLEPHVVQPSDDTADVSLVLQEIEEEGKAVSETSEDFGLKDQGSESTEDEVRQGFVRFANFVSKKGKSSFFSREAVAKRAYARQRRAIPESQEVSQLENKEMKKAV